MEETQGRFSVEAVKSGSFIPESYKAELDQNHLHPLWTAPVRARVKEAGHGPARRAKANLWQYAPARELLLQTADIVSIEEAERRVLILLNPGYDAKQVFSTTPSMIIGLQLIMPGEWAPNHRHTAAAARFIVEGDGAYTAVNGEKLAMRAGDLVLTPPHYFHEHGHDGTGPMIWLDILDLQVAVGLDTMYHVDGERTPSFRNIPDATETKYRCSGVVPYRGPFAPAPRYPVLIYRWTKVREALLATAEASGPAEPVHLMYVNPETGQSALETLSFSSRMLRPGEQLTTTFTSASKVLHVIEGEGEAEIEGQTFAWKKGDVIAVPTFTAFTLRNGSNKAPAFLFQADDSPLQHKLGYYEERAG
jgi:gentisate 1,2-dioxygenase